VAGEVGGGPGRSIESGKNVKFVDEREGSRMPIEQNRDDEVQWPVRMTVPRWLGVLSMYAGAIMVASGVAMFMLWPENRIYPSYLLLLGAAFVLVPLEFMIPCRPLRLAVVGATILVAVGGAAALYRFQSTLKKPAIANVDRPTVTEIYRNIRSGFTMDTVRELLGEPDSRYREKGRTADRNKTPYVERWRYSGGGWQFIDLYFDEHGKVVGKFMDS
jgi:hypothetical protein